MVERNEFAGRPHLRRALIGAGIAAGATLVPAAAAHAETITVTSLADDGGGAQTTLREAISAANAGAADADVIAFQSGLTGTIALTGGALEVTDSLTVNGPGPGSLSVSGNDESQIFVVDRPANPIELSISGLTLTHAYAEDALGGAIAVSGAADLTVDDCVVSDNEIADPQDEDLTAGAGIFAGYGGQTDDPGGDVVVTDSVISGNVLSGGLAMGAGIYTIGEPSTTISNTTIDGNEITAEYAYGGGGAGFVPFDQGVTITGTTISNNSTSGYGGGLYMWGGDLAMTNSTVSGNSATDAGGVQLLRTQADPPAPAYGTAALRNVTIAGNSAELNGGGIKRNSMQAIPTLTNTIVADNTATGNQQNVQGRFQGSFNLLESAPATFVDTVTGSTILNQDPQLGPLADNGGPTQTHRPALASPVVDKGSSTGGPATDQRGNGRLLDIPATPNSPAAGGNGADIGAVELTAAEAGIDSPPTAAFHFAPADPETGELVTFTSDSTDPGGSIASVSWDFNDDGVFGDATTSPATHAFATAGSHDVTLRVTDNFGGTDDVTHTVTVSDGGTVNTPPVAEFHFAPLAPQAGQVVTFTSDSTDPDPGGSIAGFSWDLDDDGVFGDATTAVTTRAFAVGDHEVTLRVTDNLGATDDVTHTLTATAPSGQLPVSSFTFAPLAPKVGETVQFNSTAHDDGQIEATSWDLNGDGAFGDATSTTPTRVFLTPGEKTISLRVTDDDGFSADSTQVVTVILPPAGGGPPGPIITPPDPNAAYLAALKKCKKKKKKSKKAYKKCKKRAKKLKP